MLSNIKSLLLFIGEFCWIIGSFWQFLTIKLSTHEIVTRILACCITLFSPTTRCKIPYNCSCFSSAAWNLSHELYIGTFWLLSTFFFPGFCLCIFYLCFTLDSSVQELAYFTVNNFATLHGANLPNASLLYVSLHWFLLHLSVINEDGS